MSGFGAFSGFGQTNNTTQQQPATGFSGFGSATTGFGSTPASGFGATSNTSGNGIFGSGTAGSTFGAATTNAFGAPKPSAFGTTPTASSGLFGSNTANNPSGAFGSGFGAAATPAFGSTNTGTGIFGGATSSPFGAPATTSAFGAPASSAISQAGVGECQGTGSVPFQACTEKEPNSNTNQQNSFQNIAFQPPYQKFSMEELRLADYNQGRRFGNGSNQAGAFGQTNFGGGFGTGNSGFGTTSNTTGGNMFGVPANNSAFGTAQPAATGFGASATTAGNGIFGAKPANTLFGSQPATQQTNGLFGSTSNSGFAGANPGASVFGQNNTAKPAFGFGSTQQNTTGNAFGTPSTTSAFGGGGGAFGSNQQQNTTTGFGTQPAQTNAFGSFGATSQQAGPSSVFGNTQNKPANSLFGTQPASTGTSGLFGSQPTNSTNAFGNNQNSGLFGSKPATGSDNIFGSTNNANSGSVFGSFGNQNQNTTQNNGLFGAANNNQAKPSIFGTSTQPSGGLFGSSTTQTQTPLFGSSSSNLAQPSQASNSLFGGSTFAPNNSLQNQQIPQSLTASISDNAAFGSQSLFSNIAVTQVSNPGPIATPLSGSRSPAASKSAALPLYKLNAVTAPRFSTPQKRGFGFSYSALGSPASVTSASSTPGTFNSSNLLGASSFGRTLNKSVSTSSLRRSFNAEDSIMAPGAFSASPSARNFSSTGSVKKLTINKNVRSDLFTPPAVPPQITASSSSAGTLKKRVSFDSTVSGNNIAASSPLRKVNTSTPSSADLGYLRPRQSAIVSQSSGSSPIPEIELAPNSNNQLAIVREEDAVESIPPEVAEDPQPGDYWMSPNKTEIDNMNRIQRQKVTGFTVGRHGVGSVRFDCPVDLTSINVNEVMGGIVKIEMRQVTVYPDSYQKPPMGKGLNVPSTITLENSWPRKKDRKTPLTDQTGVRLQKHIEKLKRVEDTEFVSYEKTTGTWTFRVPHFTTYGLPDDDDVEEADEGTHKRAAFIQEKPTILQQTSSPGSSSQFFASSSPMNSTISGPEDTFEFRKSSKFVPGAFDDQGYSDDEISEDYGEPYGQPEQQSFLDDRLIASPSESGIEEPSELDEVSAIDNSVNIVDQEMTESYVEAGSNLELIESQYSDSAMDTMTNTPIPQDKPRRMETLNIFGTPLKQQFLPGDDWTLALKTTISPRKQDRAFLKNRVKAEKDNSLSDDTSCTPTPDAENSDSRDFSTSIDLINSILGENKSPIKIARSPMKGEGFKWPYKKQKNTGELDTSNMDEPERSFHNSMKPSWGHDGTLIYAAPLPETPFGRSRDTREKNNLLVIQERTIVSEHRDIRFAKFSNETAAEFLQNHKKVTKIDVSNGVPVAITSDDLLFADFIDGISSRDQATAHEKLVWQLASILWDPLEIPEELHTIPHIESCLRKDNLSNFWKSLVSEAVTKQVALAKSQEEKAIAYLSGRRVDDACSCLVTANNPHLSTLISLIGSKDSIREEMQEQLISWRKSKMLSEFSQPIRTLYEVLAGNVCVCEGVKGPSEDRVETFTISKRFGLDWRQAFGLRLWYGTPTGESIEWAIESFAADLASEKEISFPSPWYIENKVPALWHDPSAADRIDLLWGLMKLYTYGDVDLEDILRPENSQLSPMDVRLSWQLSQVIISSDSVQFTGDKKMKADKTTLSFAAQLTNEGSWLDAVFVLLHLSSPDARAKAIQDHLGHFAGKIGTKSSQSFVTLTETFKIPVAWIWEAKALYLRSVEKDPKSEVECLIKAGSYGEAHRTFTRAVAPETIVRLDYETLQKLLDGFTGKDAVIGDWFSGGQIYQDFLELVRYEDKQEDVNDTVLQRLLCGLPSAGDNSRHLSFIERVSIETMSAVVAKAALNLANKGVKKYLASILSLPLTEDKYLKYSVELGLESFRRTITRVR
ncbi:Nucleoporin [Podosphaera aphanis]|nr:Nucleoporin [Podosphaera aphanis]